MVVNARAGRLVKLKTAITEKPPVLASNLLMKVAAELVGRCTVPLGPVNMTSNVTV
jgi:hypothetical protein